MNTANDSDLAERLEDAIAEAETDVRETAQAATESNTWTLGDCLSEHKPATVGKWIDRVQALTTIGFHTRAIAWSELIALRDGAEPADSNIDEAPVLTLADLEKEYPFEGIDEITEEERDPDEVCRERVGECHRVLEIQPSYLGDQVDHLTSAAEVGNTYQVAVALAVIGRTASAMARAYGLWMRHLEPIWSPPVAAPDDIAAEYGDWSAFAAFVNAE